MRLTVLGSGAGVPDLKRYSPGYLLETGKTKVLLDCGYGTVLRLAEMNLDLRKIGHILLTHFHLDHFCDLPMLLSSMKLGFRRKETLTIHGPPGLKKLWKNLRMIRDPKLPFRVVIEQHRGRFVIDDLRINLAKTGHTKESVAYRIEHEGKSLVFTGDLVRGSKITEFARNADVLLIECTFPKLKKGTDHISPRICGKIATDSEARTLVLTHFSDYWDRQGLNPLVETQRYFSGPIVKAEDLMVIEI